MKGEKRMEGQEQLFRINFHAKKTGYNVYLLIWGKDIFDVLTRCEAIIGPDAYYELDGINAQMDANDKPMFRPAKKAG